MATRSLRVLKVCAAAACAAYAASACADAGGRSPAREPAATLTGLSQSRDRLWSTYRAQDGDGAAAIVYAAHDRTRKPLILLIHGSGCAPVTTIDADGTTSDASIFQDVIASHRGKFHFALVEKRGVDPLRFSESMSHADKEAAFQRAEENCTPRYLREVTKQARVEDVRAALSALHEQSWVGEILLAGHSEGTSVVTGVLATGMFPKLVAAGLFASAGPTGFFSGWAATGGKDRQKFSELFGRIRMLQAADDDEMWRGLPVRRWKSFWLGTTPIEDVKGSGTPLFVAQGERDGTLAADLFVLEALRQQPKRPIRFVVVAGGDHAFDTPAGPRFGAVFSDFVEWATGPSRQSGVATVN